VGCEGGRCGSIYSLGVCEMSVGEGFMTRRAVALELICVAQVVSSGSCSYIFACGVRAGPCIPFSAFPVLQA
jgi:hypothetical protein